MCNKNKRKYLNLNELFDNNCNFLDLVHDIVRVEPGFMTSETSRLHSNI